MPLDKCLCPECLCPLGKLLLCFQVLLSCYHLQEAPLVKSQAESRLFDVLSQYPIHSFMRVFTTAYYNIGVFFALSSTRQ